MTVDSSSKLQPCRDTIGVSSYFFQDNIEELHLEVQNLISILVFAVTITVGENVMRFPRPNASIHINFVSLSSYVTLIAVLKLPVESSLLASHWSIGH